MSAAIGGGRATTRNHLFWVTLPGVVSWRRPRMQRGRMAYPERYVAERDAWANVVAAIVRDPEEAWAAPTHGEGLSVTVNVHGRGKFDLDRVLTAVLDALQIGGALADDCLVREIVARRHQVKRGQEPCTMVALGLEIEG